MKKFYALIALLIAFPTVMYAATVGDKMTFEGPVTVSGTFTTTGTVSQSGAQTFSNTVTLDDGSGASPSFVMTDATDESATFSKVDAGFLTITTVAGDGVQVTTGNLKVGNGVPDVSQDGEDAYVEGTLEVDGAVTLDGAATVAGVLTANGNVVAGNAVTDNITFTGAIQGATPFVLDGTTDNTNELSVTLGADPGADLTLTIPATISSAAMVSALTTNDANVANSVWGVSNGLSLEGATANDYETTISPTDPTADRTVTIPDATGTLNMNCTATHDYGAAAVAWTMTAAEAACSYITVSNANGAVDAVLPAATPGKVYTVNNASGQVLTFKVTGQTGGTVANAKWAFYTTGAADVLEVYELP